MDSNIVNNPCNEDINISDNDSWENMEWEDENEKKTEDGENEIRELARKEIVDQISAENSNTDSDKNFDKITYGTANKNRDNVLDQQKQDAYKQNYIQEHNENKAKMIIKVKDECVKKIENFVLGQSQKEKAEEKLFQNTIEEILKKERVIKIENKEENIDVVMEQPKKDEQPKSKSVNDDFLRNIFRQSLNELCNSILKQLREKEVDDGRSQKFEAKSDEDNKQQSMDENKVDILKPARQVDQRLNSSENCEEGACKEKVANEKHSDAKNATNIMQQKAVEGKYNSHADDEQKHEDHLDELGRIGCKVLRQKFKNCKCGLEMEHRDVILMITMKTKDGFKVQFISSKGPNQVETNLKVYDFSKDYEIDSCKLMTVEKHKGEILVNPKHRVNTQDCTENNDKSVCSKMAADKTKDLVEKRPKEKAKLQDNNENEENLCKTADRNKDDFLETTEKKEKTEDCSKHYEEKTCKNAAAEKCNIVVTNQPKNSPTIQDNKTNEEDSRLKTAEQNKHDAINKPMNKGKTKGSSKLYDDESFKKLAADNNEDEFFDKPKKNATAENFGKKYDCVTYEDNKCTVCKSCKNIVAHRNKDFVKQQLKRISKLQESIYNEAKILKQIVAETLDQASPANAGNDTSEELYFSQTPEDIDQVEENLNIGDRNLEERKDDCEIGTGVKNTKVRFKNKSKIADVDGRRIHCLNKPKESKSINRVNKNKLVFEEKIKRNKWEKQEDGKEKHDGGREGGEDNWKDGGCRKTSEALDSNEERKRKYTGSCRKWFKYLLAFGLVLIILAISYATFTTKSHKSSAPWERHHLHYQHRYDDHDDYDYQFYDHDHKHHHDENTNNCGKRAGWPKLGVPHITPSHVIKMRDAERSMPLKFSSDNPSNSDRRRDNPKFGTITQSRTKGVKWLRNGLILK